MSFIHLKSQVVDAMTSYTGIQPQHAAYLMDHVEKLSAGAVHETIEIPGMDAVTIVTEQTLKNPFLRRRFAGGGRGAPSTAVLNFGLGPLKKTVVLLGLNEAMSGASPKFTCEESSDGLLLFCTWDANPDLRAPLHKKTLEGNQNTPPPIDLPGQLDVETERKLSAEDAEGDQNTPPPDS